MARIEYKIDLDKNGRTSVVGTIIRIDPGDEIALVTNTANAALRWTAASPFESPAAESTYLMPQATAAPAPLRVLRPTLMAGLAECGEKDGNGNFTPWPGTSGFPDPSGTSLQIG
jgi:hypothetical protein